MWKRVRTLGWEGALAVAVMAGGAGCQPRGAGVAGGSEAGGSAAEAATGVAGRFGGRGGAAGGGGATDAGAGAAFRIFLAPAETGGDDANSGTEPARPVRT